MVPYGKGSTSRRVLLSVCAAALLLACISLQTHIFWSGGEVGTDQEEHSILVKYPPNFSFVIKLLTYDRLHSLVRCLDSLSAADYDTQVVKLHVFIDHFPLSNSSSFSGQILESKLQESHALLDYVHRFTWTHGPKEVHYRTQNAGLQGQWLEAWWPASDHEFAFMVEDDMRLSPLYFKYLKRVIETYYFNPSIYDPTVYGISLQRPRFVPGKHGKKLKLDDTTHLFQYQLVGTWGQLLFPKPWREFRLWYDVHKSRNLKPVLDGMVTTGWYHRSGERIWTPWFIKFAHSKGYFNLYTHFPGERALSVSYRDKGVNTKKEAGPDSNLIGNESASELHLWEMKPLRHLKRYDFCFHEVIQGRLVEKAQDVHTIAPTFNENGTILVANALGFPEDLIRYWLCQISKFRIRNYVILLQDRELEKELLQRGHAIMSLNPGLLEKEVDQIHIRKALTTVQAVTMLLQAGYNIWLADVGTLWLANPLPLVHINNFDMHGFGVAGTEISTQLLYIKACERTISFWTTIYKDVTRQAPSFTSSTSADYLGALIGHSISEDRLTFDFLSPTLKVDFLTAYRDHSAGILKLSAALLSGLDVKYIGVLKSLGLWNLDDELACTGVYC